MRRDDIVAYFYAGAADPLIKIVKALPGDRFELLPDDNESWRIIVNGRALLSPGGEPYTVTRARYPRLHLYEQDYGESLPKDTYLLLGTDRVDSFDSRAFGLADESDIVGLVIESRSGG